MSLNDQKYTIFDNNQQLFLVIQFYFILLTKYTHTHTRNNDTTNIFILHFDDIIIVLQFVVLTSITLAKYLVFITKIVFGFGLINHKHFDALYLCRIYLHLCYY